MSGDLISRSALRSDILMLPHNGDIISSEKVEEVLNNAPSVKAVPVVIGHWIDRYGNKYANHLYECSVCKNKASYKCESDLLGNEVWLQDLSDWCPSCGAKMESEE